MKNFLIIIGLCLFAMPTIAQDLLLDSLRLDKIELDSIFIAEVEKSKTHQKPKVLHAEPLYIDLIRDLGARKGEKEWNIGMGLTDTDGFDEYETLVEYEWAPVDRLGLEIEVPVTIYSNRGSLRQDLTRPSNRVESLKLAGQWSFLVSEKAKTTLALGYIHEFELVDLKQIQWDKFLKGNVYNPFFIAAKRWGTNYHTLIYTGPRFEKEFNRRRELHYEIHTNFHYMITGTRNFVGLEINKEIHEGKLNAVLRPQMRVGISENLMIGIVTGIPLSSQNDNLSAFMRIIYEPGFRALH